MVLLPLFAMLVWMQVSLLPFWALIHSLQLLLHVPMLNIQLPGQISLVNSQLLDIVRFGYWNPFDDMWDQNEGYIMPILNQSGYHHYSFIPNIGLIYVGMMILFTLTFLTTCLPHVLPFGLIKCHKSSAYIFNFSIRFTMLVFFEVALCAMINFTQPELLTVGHRTSLMSAAGIAVMATCFLICMTFLRYAVSKQTQYVFPYFKTVLLGMNLNHPERAATFQSWFLARRALFAINIVFFGRYPLLQILLTLISSTSMIRILWKSNPFDSQMDRRQHITNEILIFVVCCSLICFTDVQTNLTVRLYLQYFYLSLLIALIVINLVFIAITICR